MNKIIMFGMRHTKGVAITEALVGLGFVAAVVMGILSAYWLIAPLVVVVDLTLARSKGLI